MQVTINQLSTIGPTTASFSIVARTLKYQ